MRMPLLDLAINYCSKMLRFRVPIPESSVDHLVDPPTSLDRNPHRNHNRSSGLEHPRSNPDLVQSIFIALASACTRPQSEFRRFPGQPLFKPLSQFNIMKLLPISCCVVAALGFVAHAHPNTCPNCNIQLGLQGSWEHCGAELKCTQHDVSFGRCTQSIQRARRLPCDALHEVAASQHCGICQREEIDLTGPEPYLPHIVNTHLHLIYSQLWVIMRGGWSCGMKRDPSTRGQFKALCVKCHTSCLSWKISGSVQKENPVHINSEPYLGSNINSLMLIRSIHKTWTLNLVKISTMALKPRNSNTKGNVGLHLIRIFVFTENNQNMPLDTINLHSLYTDGQYTFTNDVFHRSLTQKSAHSVPAPNMTPKWNSSTWEVQALGLKLVPTQEYSTLVAGNKVWLFEEFYFKRKATTINSLEKEKGNDGDYFLLFHSKIKRAEVLPGPNCLGLRPTTFRWKPMWFSRNTKNEEREKGREMDEQCRVVFITRINSLF
ncbi:hypothetical protein VP01_374g2 [Puccinia sorghi]|uniref:Uncharacterized protein n=1 Tax=Puccinia sorghi TaxID=27349 RepID=A0A0L6UTZ4_9BASI|nr:hypothetical protein VP01_374g2 [Puccinia sorghi]